MNDFSPLVSVVIPVYNSEAFLKACILSVINQTYSNIEIIIVNDGSTDDSLQIIENCKIDDTRILLINKSNEGPSLARESGVDIARGKYIQFLDSDDELLNDAIERLVNRAEATNADIVVAPFFFCTSGEPKILSHVPGFEELLGVEYMKKILGGKTYWSVWSHFIRRSLICNNAIETVPNISFGEDAIMMIQLALCAQKVSFIGTAILNYMIHPSSISHPQNFNDKKYQEFEAYTAWMVNYVNKMGLAKEMAEEIALFYIRNTFMSICWRRDCGLDKKMEKLVLDLKQFPKLKHELSRRERKIASAYRISIWVGNIYLWYCRNRRKI